VSKFPIVLLYRIVTNLIHAYAAELVAREPRNNASVISSNNASVKTSGFLLKNTPGEDFFSLVVFVIFLFPAYIQDTLICHR
jgi:hypothetical protein